MFTSLDVLRSPFLRITIPFILGIILFICIPTSPNLLYNCIFFFLIVLYISLSVIPSIRSKFNVSRYLSLLTILIIFYSGYYYTSVFNISGKPESHAKGFIIAEVLSQPQKKEKSIKVEAEVLAVKNGEQWEHTEGKVLLYLEKTSVLEEIETGDRIIFEPVLQNVRNPGNPKEFDYKKYLAFNLISQQAYLKTSQFSIIKNDQWFNLKKYAGRIRNKVIEIMKSYGLSGDELAVVSALSVGYKDDLDAEIKQSYSSTGAMHVLAVSGLHVGIIFIIFNFLLSFLDKKKWQKIFKSFLLIALLWFYALLTGLSPSISRAALMFTFIIAANSLGRYTNTYNSLAFSAFVLLVINPFNITNIGFQFSYLAVIGILYFYPKIYSLVYIKNKWTDKIWSLVCVSIAAQLITAPLGIYYFHQFPNYFILTNIIVIPAATIIIYLVLFLVAIYWWPFAGKITGNILSEITYYLNKIISGIEHLPGAVSSDIPMELHDTLLIYIVLFSFSLFLIYKRFTPFIISLSCIFLFLVSTLIKNYALIIEKEIYVYNISGHLALNLIDGKKNYLFTSLDNNNTMYSYSLKNNWISKGLENEKTISLKKLNNQFILSNLFYLNNPNVFYKDNIFAFYDKHFALIRNEVKADTEIKNRIDLDFLILSHNARVDISTLLLLYNPKSIIIAPSNSSYRIKKWKEEAKDIGINIYDVQEKGAFFMKLS